MINYGSPIIQQLGAVPYGTAPTFSIGGQGYNPYVGSQPYYQYQYYGNMYNNMYNPYLAREVENKRQELYEKEIRRNIDSMKRLSTIAHHATGTDISIDQLNSIYNPVTPSININEYNRNMEDTRVAMAVPITQQYLQNMYIRNQYAMQQVHNQYSSISTGNISDFFNKVGEIYMNDKFLEAQKRQRNLSSYYDPERFKAQLMNVPTGREVMGGALYVPLPSAVTDDEIKKRRQAFWDAVNSSSGGNISNMVAR